MAFAGNVNRIGDNTQNQCQWYAFDYCCGNGPKMLDLGLYAAKASTTTIGTDFPEVWFERSYQTIQFRNAGNESLEVAIWRCTPRTDMPQTTQGLKGLNPTQFTEAFAATDAEVVPNARAITYNDWCATPFNSPLWCRMFKCKMLTGKTLGVGDGFKLDCNLKKGFVVSAARFGCTGGVAGATTNTVIFDQWRHLRCLGPILLMRVRGTVFHDESTTGGSNPTVTVGQTGSFSLDFAVKCTAVFRIPYNIATRTQNFAIQSAPAVCAKANEAAYSFVLPAEQAPNL
jgi:hypothetical protein